MAIRRPGSRSNVSLLSSGVWSIIGLIILIGGHIILGYLVLSSFFGNDGLKTITADTKIPTWALTVMVAGAVIMDLWILYSMRQARKRRNVR